jgi:dipeptidyl aminopeptidase/acylaminoacyl peptidase
LYSAIKGFGGTARLVYLPFEAHSYKAKESVLHMLYEMDAWLEKYVKNK